MPIKKKYYVPGLISLIGLPFLAFFFSPEIAVKPTALRIVLPHDGDSGSKFILRFSKTNFLKSITRKKVIELDLFENNQTRDLMLRRKFDFILRELDRMNFTGDTTTVLKVNIDDQNTFGDVIWLVNQTVIYNIRHWAIIDNSFYFVNFKPPAYHSNTTPIIYPTL
jgi:hypothetical protein